MNFVLDELLKNNVEYALLPYQFFLLTVWGIWCPKNVSHVVRNLHILYFVLIFFLDSLILVEMVIHFISSLGTNKFKLINLFLVSANITGVYKAIKVMRNRENLRFFIKYYFNYQWMNSLDPGEDEIHEKINARIRFVIDKE